MQQQRQDLRRSITLEIEQARYEARLAARRYEAVDPDQRLVAAELELRWNAALQKTQQLENKLSEFDDEIQSRPAPNRSEEHTSELQSHSDLVCRLLLEKKKKKIKKKKIQKKENKIHN